MKAQIITKLLFLIAAFAMGCRGNKQITTIPTTTIPEYSPLQIIIDLEKSSYQLDEAIKVTIKLQNTGVPVMVNVRFAEKCLDSLDENWEISFLIFDPQGQQYTPPRCIYVDWARPWYQELQKGDSYEYTFDDIRDFYRLTVPGKYTIQIKYHNVLGSTSIWKGELTSNIVTITIAP